MRTTEPGATFSTSPPGPKYAGTVADTLGYGTDGKITARPAMSGTPVAMRQRREPLIATAAIAPTTRATPSHPITIRRAGSALPMRGSFATPAHGSHTAVAV